TQAAVGRMRQTAHRIARILDADRPTATKIWKPALGLVSALSVACLISVSHAPQLVAFDQAGSGVLDFAAVTPAPALDSAGLGARMIPATLRSPVPSVTTARKAVLARAVNRQKNDHELAASVAPAKFAPPPTKVINARANGSVANVAHPGSVLLVMHTEQVDEYGQVWDVCIWRLTVFHPLDRGMDRGIDRAVHKAITPKST
ncbi:MAG: hypothetical protein WCA99_00585, partial [Candidatus Sulfotelmatobacter sp.]